MAQEQRAVAMHCKAEKVLQAQADARFHFTVSAVSQPLWLCKVPQEHVPPLPIYMLTLHSHPISVADVG